MRGASGYGIGFAIAVGGVTLAAIFAFWALTEGEVRRSSEAAEIAVAPPPPPPPVPVDTLTEIFADSIPEWQRGPLLALRDTLFYLRGVGRLDDALDMLERWLNSYPSDRTRRLEAARLAFEVQQPERGADHYARYLGAAPDSIVLYEAVDRTLRELEPALARRTLARLLGVDNSDYFVRIRLAQAHASAGEFSAADSLLQPIAPYRMPGVDELRLVVRRSLNPDIPTALRWVSEYPGEVHYRLVLARALARGERYAEALDHYVAAFSVDTSVALREETGHVAVAAGRLDVASDILAAVIERDSTRASALLAYARARARLGDRAGAVRAFERLMALSPDEGRFSEARGVLFEVDDPALTLPLLGRLVAFRPEDDAMRLRYAQDLERTGAVIEAEVQYDTLIARAPSGPLLLARARLRAGRNDLPGALADAVNSEAREVTVEAPLLQGEIHRWREERPEARRAYDRAELAGPGDERIAEARRLLALQRKRVLTELPPYGTQGFTSAIGDSDGFESFSLRAQEGFAPFTGETVLLVGGELRSAVAATGVRLTGIGGDVGMARLVGRTLVLARAGALVFDGSDPALNALLEATYARERASIRASISAQPAYESLRSEAALSAGDIVGATTALASVSAQLTPALDIYVQADHTWISDGNTRAVAAGSGRYRLGDRVSLLYTTGVAVFADRDTSYWTPEWFVAQGIGLDIRNDKPQGWSVGLRLNPGYAWARNERPDGPQGTHGAFQGTAVFDATWRRDRWEIGGFAGYGQDRAGTYSAGFGGLRARVTR